MFSDCDVQIINDLLQGGTIRRVEEVSLLIYSKCFLGASKRTNGEISFIIIQIVSQKFHLNVDLISTGGGAEVVVVDGREACSFELAKWG